MRELKWWLISAGVLAAAVFVGGWLSLTTRKFLLTNWGNLASVVGLILSLLAAILASRASKAAEGARRAVLSRTMAEEISGGYKLASEITMLIGISQFNMALTKCSDLLDVPNRIRIRWLEALATTSKNNWLLARQQLDSIHAVLAKASSGTTLTPRELAQLTKSCLSVRTIFVEEQTTATKAADQR